MQTYGVILFNGETVNVRKGDILEQRRLDKVTGYYTEWSTAFAITGMAQATKAVTDSFASRHGDRFMYRIVRQTINPQGNYERIPVYQAR
jgi:hypothetical protein